MPGTTVTCSDCATPRTASRDGFENIAAMKDFVNRLLLHDHSLVLDECHCASAISGTAHTTSAGAGAMAAELLNLRFIWQVVSGRWFMIFASLLILSSGGATYAFGM
ncbi:hypothetical protein HU200_054018 [Digitaria exilis]|uniref:Uncharacterized protein n=1 Tax=Digitaria exilis TaxID=1010633 RepID=A0A835ALB5_9POAL|nr:hypothetical protein HU200_054018 [Digitaria exilis]